MTGGDSERRGTRATAAESVCVGVRGGQTAGATTANPPTPPILPAREQRFQLRMSRRTRRDAHPHARHLLRHPELHRAALPGAAEVDGAHARARAVRAGGQADAALGFLQPRGRRGVQPAAGVDQGSDAVHQAGDRPPWRRRDGQGLSRRPHRPRPPRRARCPIVVISSRQRFSPTSPSPCASPGRKSSARCCRC